MYCESPGVTKAHVFAESFTKLFDDANDPREHVVRHDYTDPSTGDERVLKRSRTFALKTRKVCRGCNGGWLGELEENVVQTLRRFAENTPFRLRGEEQETLALWAFCATLHGISLTAVEDERFAAPELAHEVYATRRPSAGTQIWLGANSHGEMASFSSHSLVLPSSVRGGQAFGASLSFGYGNVHVIHHGVTHRRIQLRHELHRAFKQTWPVRGDVAWPPRVVARVRDLSPVALMIGANSAWVGA